MVHLRVGGEGVSGATAGEQRGCCPAVALYLFVFVVQELLESLGGAADSFVCGPDGFVEVASALLMQAGQPGQSIRTERFGPTGT